MGSDACIANQAALEHKPCLLQKHWHTWCCVELLRFNGARRILGKIHLHPGPIMPVSFDGKLVIAISSRALFNLADSHKVYLEEGLEAFQDYQTRHEDDVLEPGDAFTLVQKLLAINELKEGKGRVEVILLSRNLSLIHI